MGAEMRPQSYVTAQARMRRICRINFLGPVIQGHVRSWTPKYTHHRTSGVRNSWMCIAVNLSGHSGSSFNGLSWILFCISAESHRCRQHFGPSTFPARRIGEWNCNSFLLSHICTMFQTQWGCEPGRNFAATQRKRCFWDWRRLWLTHDDICCRRQHERWRY